tara:strand:- start:7226 stop:7882 length:657 start_codon:yes stop_codon:yes gene_type:complete
MDKNKYKLSKKKRKKLLWFKNYLLLFNNCNNRYINIINSKYYTFKYLFSKFDIYTTRFNNITYEENVQFKKNSSFNGCIYGVDKLQTHNRNKVLFVLDMNNDKNKIMGIGIIICSLSKNQDIDIYSKDQYNKYIYKGNYYINILNNPNILSHWKKFIYDEFERNLFWGKSNQKRSRGITRFPFKLILSQHILFILNLFIHFNPNNFTDNQFIKDFIGI